ncbi:MAG: FecR family protein [Paracoccaceae bacterium]|nr:FecR family protein [Paracoccaceae bacterium]
MNFFRFVATLFVAIVLGWAGPVSAQVPPNCNMEQVTDPDRKVLKCAFGLIIELDAAAEMGISGAILEIDPTDINLQSGAAFIEVEPGSARPQIRTPHAIAAVRGTIYVVDVSAEVTSVFVLQGEVFVASTNALNDSVVLGPGEGVDVGADADLTVRTWPEERVRALLARFGR